MKPRSLLLLPAALILGACAAVGGPDGLSDDPDATLPEAVRSIAAPYQNLDTARLREEDGCYWYLHTGPVESTLLPLRTVEGRPICTRPQSTPATAAAET
ncbi:MAG: hypothetical protein RIE24_11440 [Silicimonas sp.]